MQFWRRKQTKGEKEGVIAAVIRGESLYALRDKRSNEETNTLDEAIISLRENTDVLGELYERFGSSPNESMYIAGPSSSVVGEAFAVSLPRHEENQAVVRDSREALYMAQWQAGDKVREKAAQYFGSSLEDIVMEEPLVENFQETSSEVFVTLFQSALPSWGDDEARYWQELMPEAQWYRAPLLTASAVGEEDTPEAVLYTEDKRSVLVVRHKGAVTHLRSMEIGVNVLRDHLSSTLDCSPREAETLLRLAAKDDWSNNNKKLILRILRELIPLWAGMFEVWGSEIREAERPRRLVVSGLYPFLVAKYFCRPQFVSRCAVPPAKVEIFPSYKKDVVGVFGALQTIIKQLNKNKTKISPKVAVSFLQTTSRV